MTVTDFIDKKRREIRQDGVAVAGKRAVGEVVGKGLGKYARRRATPIWDAEWDVALVLDACRFDLWRQVVDEYPHDSAWSVGSASVEWLNETFADQYADEWRRAGMVTANPHTGHPPDFSNLTDTGVYPLRDRGLAYLDEVWSDQWKTQENLPTVTPDRVTDRAMWAWDRREQHSIDQLVVHYMQPHIPFRSHPEWSPGWSNKLQFGKPLSQYGKKDDWAKLRDGEIEWADLWLAYGDNLEWVLEEVDRWVHATDARILITSDHGNGAGEWGIYGHPPGNGAPVLRNVPFVTVDGTGDRAMDYDAPGDPPVIDSAGEHDRQERLQALGYR